MSEFIRVAVGVPQIRDFASSKGTPIVVDALTGIAYYLYNNEVRSIQDGLMDSSLIDAFGRLRVSSPMTLFDSQQEYGLNTNILWDATANGALIAPSSNGSVSDGSGNSVGPRNINSRLTPVTVSSTNGHYSILQSRQYIRYLAGKSHLVYITGVFAAGAGYAASIVRRTATSGSVVDNVVNQADWNIDKMDGTGPSKINLDFTKAQVLCISAQWLGEGRVVISFDVDGRLRPAHQFVAANFLSVPYTQAFNLPVRLEMRNTGPSTCVSRVGYFDYQNGIFLQCSRSTLGGTINLCCTSVQSEAGARTLGFPRTAGNGITTVGVTTRRPILSIRHKLTFNGLPNRAHIDLEEFLVRAKTNDAYFEVVFGGTLTGAAFTSVAPGAISEFDVSATAITGGIALWSGFVNTGVGAGAGQGEVKLDSRTTLTIKQIDALAATLDPVSIVCTSFTGTSDVSGTMNWHEHIT